MVRYIEVEHRDKECKIVDIETIELSMFCDKVYHDMIGILTNIEDLVYGSHGFDDKYRKIRHKIFNVAGAVKRLPDSIVER